MGDPCPRRARSEQRRQRTEERHAAGRNAPWRSRFRKVRRAVGNLFVGWFAPLLVRLFAWTWRIERRGDPGLTALRSGAPCVIVLWHGRMLVAMPLWPHRHRGIGVLVSPSDDGSLVTKALTRFGYTVVRGSSSRGGASALRDLDSALRGGRPVVLTPDGPRGPRHSVNAGPAWLARSTGAPIVTVSIAVDRAWRLRSWDRFTIPKPFARLLLTYGGPVTVPPDRDDASLERLALQLRDEMVASELAGFAALGVPDDHEAG